MTLLEPKCVCRVPMSSVLARRAALSCEWDRVRGPTGRDKASSLSSTGVLPVFGGRTSGPLRLVGPLVSARVAVFEKSSAMSR